MSDFLRKLREAVETGKTDDSIKAGFDESLNKADKLAADPSAIKDIQDKLENAAVQEGITLQRTMTREEMEALNKLAREQEEAIYKTQQNEFITAGVVAFNCEVETLEQEIENRKLLISEYTQRGKYLQGDDSYEKKKALIDKSINEFNKRGKSGKIG